MGCLCECIPSIGQVIFTLVAFYTLKFAYVWYKSNASKNVEPKIQKQDWKKDVVYLYQFARPSFTPQLSPFCLKVEAYCRLHNLKYEVIETSSGRSKKGLLPFIELNGEHIADSQFIIFHLRKHFNIEDDLTEEQQAVERSFEQLLDSSFFKTANWLKIKDDPGAFLKIILDIGKLSFLHFLVPLAAPLMKSMIKKRFSDVAQHSDDEVMMLIRKDLQAIEKYLGNKEWFFGNQPSYIDILLFSHVAAIYYLPIRHLAKDLVESEFPKILKHIKKVEQKYFSEFKFIA